MVLRRPFPSKHCALRLRQERCSKKRARRSSFRAAANGEGWGEASKPRGHGEWLRRQRERARTNISGALIRVWTAFGVGGGSGRGGRRLMGLGPNGEGGDYPRGYGATAALAYTLAKLMVCWCSGDPLEVAKLIDLGFLMSMSVLSVAALTPALARARPLLVETALVHILLEMGVYLVALPRMGDVAPEKGLMSPAMVLHHLATVLGGVGMVTSGVRTVPPSSLRDGSVLPCSRLCHFRSPPRR